MNETPTPKTDADNLRLIIKGLELQLAEVSRQHQQFACHGETMFDTLHRLMGAANKHQQERDSIRQQLKEAKQERLLWQNILMAAEGDDLLAVTESIIQQLRQSKEAWVSDCCLAPMIFVPPDIGSRCKKCDNFCGPVPLNIGDALKLNSDLRTQVETLREALEKCKTCDLDSSVWQLVNEALNSTQTK